MTGTTDSGRPTDARNTVSRRSFMGVTASAATAALGAPALLRGSPANTIGIGVIGPGGRGTALLRQVVDQPDVEIRMVADVYSEHRARAAQLTGNPRVRQTREYREVLDSPDIDAVIVAPPDHWHAQIAVDAVAAGKDIYLEKPVTRTVDEAKRVVAAVRNSDRVFQLGHQRRSQAKQYRARELVRSGVLGEVYYVHAFWFMGINAPAGGWAADLQQFRPSSRATAETVWWDRWLGDSPRRPFDPARFFRWRLFRDYSSGMGGDMASHLVDAANIALEFGIPETATAMGSSPRFKDGREWPAMWDVLYQFPDRDLTLHASVWTHNGRFRSGYILHGTQATMEVLDAGDIRLYPEPFTERFRWAGGPEKAGVNRDYYETIGPATYPQMEGHMENFLSCVRSRARCTAHIDTAWEEIVTARMGVRAYLDRRVVRWDGNRKDIVAV